MQDRVTNRIENVPVRDVAEAELHRRGERLNAVELSLHAIDRFSTRHLKLWQQYANAEEGIATFVERAFTNALKNGNVVSALHGTITVEYCGARFVYSTEAKRPVLVTVE